MGKDTTNLFDLVQGCLDDALSPSEFNRLQELLAKDAHAVEIFAHAARLDYMFENLLARENPNRETANLLLATLGIDTAGPSAVPGPRPTSSGQTLECESEPLVERGQLSLPLQSSLLDIASRIASVNRRYPIGRIAAAVAVCAAIFLAVWMFDSISGADGSAKIAAPKNEPSNVLAAQPSLGVGEVRVDEGTARLRLPDVGYVLVDGPAELELLSPMRLRLDRGRINVTVTEPTGHGFVVVTPHGEITDLGTKFGVDATDDRETGLVVFEGAVDLRMPGTLGNVMDAPPIERLIGGDGVLFKRDGHLDRILSISTGKVATFERSSNSGQHDMMPTIATVSDNLRTNDTKRFYEIVSAGLQEDAKAYVDRPHEWNGVDADGLPEFLIGADYVMTFNDDKRKRNLEVSITFSRDAFVYVFYDSRSPTPEWLSNSFQSTGIEIGLDEGPSRNLKKITTAVGPGESIDTRFGVWRSTVNGGETLVLGPPKGQPVSREEGNAMYGIAATSRGKMKQADTDNKRVAVPR
ncbi:MAG: FecR family protein [Pirellulales bacterium]